MVSTLHGFSFLLRYNSAKPQDVWRGAIAFVADFYRDSIPANTPNLLKKSKADTGIRLGGVKTATQSRQTEQRV